MSDVVISVEHLGKRYRIAHQAERQRYTALRDVIADRAKSLFRRVTAKGKALSAKGDAVTAKGKALSARGQKGNALPLALSASPAAPSPSPSAPSSSLPALFASDSIPHRQRTAAVLSSDAAENQNDTPRRCGTLRS